MTLREEGNGTERWFLSGPVSSVTHSRHPKSPPASLLTAVLQGETGRGGMGSHSGSGVGYPGLSVLSRDSLATGKRFRGH